MGVSLCSYLVKQLHRDAPDTLQVITELDILSRRTELALEDVNKNILTLSNNLKNMQSQLSKPPINTQDKFAEQMKVFYTKANEELSELRAFYTQTVDCYTATCTAFGENAKTLKSTELFSYIVTFIDSLKVSHKHLLDLQAEEKLKKVAQDWQNLALTNTMHRQQANSGEKTTLPSPPQFRLPPQPAGVKDKRPPPLPSSVAAKNSTEQVEPIKNEKKRSLWARLTSWGH